MLKPAGNGSLNPTFVNADPLALLLICMVRFVNALTATVEDVKAFAMLGLTWAWAIVVNAMLSTKRTSNTLGILITLPSAQNSTHEPSSKTLLVLN